MLSFSQHSKKKSIAIAHGFHNERCEGKPAFTIWYIQDYTSPPEITTSDPEALMTSERYRICKEFSLSFREYEILLKRVANSQPVLETSSRTMKRAYLEIQKIMHNKLRKSLEFNGDNVWLKPIYSTVADRTNQILTAFGSSGAGKSWMLNDIMCRNPAVLSGLVPMVYKFSSVENDPSFQGLRDLMGEKFVYKDPRDLTPEDLNVKAYDKKSVLIFDDINSISDKRVRNMVLNFRNNCLEIARHRSLVILNSDHLYHARNLTAKLRNSSAYMVFYPRNSPKPIDDVLEHTMNMSKHERVDLIKKIIKEARSQFIRMDSPSFLVNSKRCMLF